MTVKTTNKYKTNKILISFTTNIKDSREITARTLLADLLESSSQHLPTQQKVALTLSEMYGASFGTSVSRYGQVYGVNFIINVVNDKFLPVENNLLRKAFSFLAEMIFAPQIKGGKFQSDIFKIQKTNLFEYLNSLGDNKQGKALTQMNALYFRDALQQIPPVGQVADLADINEKNMASYYQKMVTEDRVNVVVSGAVDQDEVLKAVDTLPFVKRGQKALSLFYSQPRANNIKEKKDKEKVSQSKLNLAYNLPVKFSSSDRFAAMVFNELFGGSALSLLFQNVREKNSLAYYAESDLDLFRQEMWVQTGIQPKDKDLVLNLIAEQLQSIQAGDIDLTLLKKIKSGMVNGYIGRMDDQSAVLSKALSGDLLGILTSEKDWLDGVVGVQLKDVVRVARLVRLQAVYFLDGGL